MNINPFPDPNHKENLKAKPNFKISINSNSKRTKDN